MEKKEFKVGDKVKLPFDEVGIIVEISKKFSDWFPYKVKITTGRTFNAVGDVTEFKEHHLQHE